MLLVIVLMMMLPVRVMRHVPLEYNRKVQGAISYVTKFLEELIQERKREMFMNLDDPDYLEKNGRKDIISTAMTSNAFSNDDLVNQSKTFLAAGHDT
jgi:cytochrome P450